MRFRNLSRWSTDAALDGAKFFAQRLEEMLHDYTLDSYKPPALNPPFLVKEALDLISDIESGVINYANLEHVLEELVWSVRNDKITKKLLDAEIEYYTSIANENELPSLKLRLEVLHRTINPTRYIETTIAELIEGIEKNEKGRIDKISRTLISVLINSGVSRQRLNDLVNDYFFGDGPKIEALSALEGFFEAIFPKIHRFDVLIIASKNVKLVSDSIAAFKLSLTSPTREDINSFCIKQSFQPGTEETYVLAVDIEAKDQYTARQRAFDNLDRLSDLLAIFQHRSRITWRAEAVVIQKCCDDKTNWVTPPKGPMEKVEDLRPEKAAKELNTFLRTFSAKGMSFIKFNRVADIHGICVNHNIVDNQLVNLWTGLETLTPSHAGNSKISNIISASLPFLMHKYIGRLVRQFTYDLLNWDKWRAKKILNKVPCDAKTPLTGKALRLLCLEENNNLRTQLYDYLKDFHLLRYRAFRLAEVLSDKNKIRDLLSEHEKKVSWQIRRIYRTRNLIVHSGRMPPPYIDTLVENGHDYLDTIVFEVMRISCGSYAATSLEQVFEIANIRHKDFYRKLSKSDPHTNTNCDYLLGELRYFSDPA